MLRYVEGVLRFREPWIAHCVSADRVLGKGFAAQVPEDHRVYLKELPPKQVGEFWLTDMRNPMGGKELVIAHLITKRRVMDKPTRADFTRTICNFAAFCKRRRITEVHIPKIGAGLDGLEWDATARLLEALPQVTFVCHVPPASLPKEEKELLARGRVGEYEASQPKAQ